MDAVQKANSGHPGTPMALAPLAFVLWDRYLRHNPRNPHWPGRDRFILSNGHACMLLYAMLYLTGYDLSLDDLKQFRQWESKTPGHPEYHHVPGLEVTTGPLGQGVANSVGMAMAQRWLAAQFNKGDSNLFDYRIYAICGDGDLMEGVSNEAASIAGHLGLSNLIWFYDNNHITIEGHTSLAFSDDVATRFRGWHWNVQRVSDVNDLDLLDVAIQAAQREAGSSVARSLSIPTSDGARPTARTPRKLTARLWAKTKFASPRLFTAGLPMRISWFPTKSKNYMSKSRRARREMGAGMGRAISRHGRSESRSRQDVAADVERGTARRVGTKTSRHFPPTPKALATRDVE